MKVNFNYFDEFLHEVEKDRDLIDRKIVRVTRQWKHDVKLSPIQHIYILASFSVRANPYDEKDFGRIIVCLSQYCGNFAAEGSEKEKTMRQVDEILNKLETKLGELGIDIRAGTLDD